MKRLWIFLSSMLFVSGAMAGAEVKAQDAKNIFAEPVISKVNDQIIQKEMRFFSDEQRKQAVEKYGLKVISRESIHEQKKVIHAYFASNKKKRVIVRVTTALSVLAVAAGLYYYFTKPSIPSVTSGDMKALENSVNYLGQKIDTIIVQEKNPAVAAVASVSASTSFFGSALNGVKGIATGLYEFGKNTADFLVKQTPLVAVTLAANHFIFSDLPTISKLLSTHYERLVLNPIDRVVHPIDTPWFMEHYLPFNTVINHVRVTLQELLLIDRCDQKEREHQIVCLVSDMNILMVQFTRLAAFLEIQSDLLMKESKASGLHLKRLSARFVAIIESLPLTIAPLLSDVDSYVDLPLAFHKFEQQVSQLLRQYRLYEKAVLMDILPPDQLVIKSK